MKKILAIVVLFGLIGYALWQMVSQNNIETGVQVGNMAPNFELELLNGESVKLSDYQGKKVILNFWASWCGPCKVEMPEMEQFSKEHGKDVVILAVNMTVTEKNLETVEKYIEEGGFTFPVLIDADNNVSTTYEALSLPTSYYIDTEGIIQKKIIGPMTVETMEQNTEKLD